MYICNECEEVFEEPKIIEEHHPYGMGFATEEWAVWPFCQDSDIQEAERCEECGQYVAELGDGLCEACYCGLEG